MHSRIFAGVLMAALSGLVIDVRTARCDEPSKSVPSETETEAPRQPARKVIGKALEFMQKDAVKWRKDRICATCHHGTMTVWAMNEARSQGYAVNAEALAEVTEWTRSRFLPKLDQPRDARPGWNLVSMPSIYLGMMSYNLPVLSRDEVNQLARHLARHQEEDGTWLLPSPPENGAPPIWESRETLALLAILAWEPNVSADSTEAAAARARREKTVEWLRKTEPTDTAQANTWRLLRDVRAGQPAEQIQSGIDQLLKRQNSDGGWGQLKELASDGYATGQALYVLSFAGVQSDRPEIQRAVAFLVATQRDDGSWPMTSRNHPGVVTTRNPIPITYFGSAWATLGLVRSVPIPPPDLVTRQQTAFDQIRGFHGKFEVDETSPDKPVVRVDLRNYEVDDLELATFAKVLQAFPQLTTLQFKSTKITDAGLTHFKSLPQLRSLTLENAAITDAGLAHLKSLSYLEALNIKGTKVTDAGVQDFQKSQPKVNVER